MKQGAISFMLGFVLGKVGVPIAVHTTYLAIIASLIFYMIVR